MLLQDDGIDDWLDNTPTESDVQNGMDDDLPDELLQTYPISKDLYKRNGAGYRPDIIRRVDYDAVEITYTFLYSAMDSIFPHQLLYTLFTFLGRSKLCALLLLPQKEFHIVDHSL